MKDMHRIKCKIVVRVELVAEGEPEPEIYRNGRPPLAQFLVHTEGFETGFAFTGVEASIPDNHPQMLCMVDAAIGQVAPTIKAFKEGDKSITKMEYRHYGDDNSYEVVADLKEPRTLN